MDYFGVKGVFLLIDGCRGMHHLKLDLSGNRIDDNGFIDFMGSLGGFTKNKTLKSIDLNLSRNPIGNLSMVAF